MTTFDAAVGIPFGIRDGALVHISDVPSGLDCRCTCPACGLPLVGKKGSIMAHHFAHAAGADCAKAYESAIHRAAKEVLERRREIVLPAVNVVFPSDRSPIPIAGEGKFLLESVAAEQRVNNIVADLLASISGNRLIVEIAVTHKVDREKLERIRQLDISAIEVDLSDLPMDTTLAEVERHVVDSSNRKQWLFNSAANAELNRMLAAARTVEVVSRGLALHVDYCPIPMRVWKGKPYANFVDECLHCQYALAVGGNMGSVTCAAFNSDLRAELDNSPPRVEGFRRLRDLSAAKDKEEQQSHEGQSVVAEGGWPDRVQNSDVREPVWKISIPSEQSTVGKSRVIHVSKSTGEVLFDGWIEE